MSSYPITYPVTRAITYPPARALLGRAGVPAGPVTIGGVAVGTAGTGALSGFTMVGGEDFSSSLSSLLVTPSNPAGKIAHNYSERDRRRTSTTSVFSLADPFWTGFEDLNDGVKVSSFSDVLSQSSSVLAMKTRRATAPEKAILGVRDQTASAITYVTAGDSNGVNSLRPMVTAHPTLAQSFAYTGNRIVEVRWRYTPGATAGGTGNPSNAIWELNARGGSEQGDNAGAEYNDEADWFELYFSSNSVTRYASGLSSGGNCSPLHDGTWQITRATVSNSIFKLDTVSDTTGSVIGTASLTNSGQNNSQLFYMMFGPIAVTTGYDENQWVGKEAVLEVDYVRVWTPSSTGLAPQVAHERVVLDYNGSGSLVLPSQVSLWGQTVDSEQITPFYAYESNGPGRTNDQTSPLATRDALPTGVTWNSGTRTLSFANTFTTHAGFVNLLVYPRKAGFGFVKPHIVTVVVKPKLAIPTPTAAVPGQPWTWTVPRGSPRNWDNGNMPLGTGDGLTVTSMPAWVSYNSATKTFSGTAPDPLTDTAISFQCTNGAGYTATQTTNIAVFAPSSLTGLVYAWDTTDTTNTPDDGSGKVAQMFHLYDNTKYLGRTTAANRPVLSASGGPSSNKRVVTFASASSQLLRSSEGSGLTALAQLLNAVNVQTPIGYIAFAAKANSAAITNRFVQFTSADGTVFYSLRQTSTTRGLSYQSSGQGTVAVTDASPDANWHVCEFIKNGSTITLTVDGVQIATGTIAQTAAFTAADFIIGGTSAGAGVATAQLDGAFGPGIVASAIPSTGDRLFSRQWIANKMGITTA